MTLTEAYYNRGIANYYLENFQGALEDFNKALQFNPNNTKYLIARGITYSALEAIEEAINDYNQVLKINLNNYYAYFNRAVAYSIIGNKQKALGDYNRALQINPDKADAYYNRGNIRYELGDKHGAKYDYGIALQINPNKADAYYNRGNIHHESAEKDKAIEDFKKAAEIYKQKSQEIDYQDVIDKIQLLKKIEYPNKNISKITEENFTKIGVNYSFDVLAQHKDIWKEFLKDITNNISCKWQIVSRINKKFIRIIFFGDEENYLMLNKKFQEYKEFCIKNIKSDFDININIEITEQENCIYNIDQEFNKISDNNYSAQFESNMYDTWSDCGYMNDIINPYEVY